ncbi:Co2+/Mg2+ efflux protein ApaG [Rhodospira trueperi]|uniref:Protein ApaG n=1 Tax=Rhodospira trueperi TaxID=69960 RepID=A0A1G6XTL8_9PROT|nr:Co2+/Mg2+ efflux protein ApaG [Rhodospira trueperi]SDD81539.1 ApaG protein [Rhodospira trueperi]
MYSSTTRDIHVTVRPLFLEDQSEPDEGHFVWAYQVVIGNEGANAVQLMRRHWVITDANGSMRDVEGAGVVGAQPVLHPGEVFEYTSGCPLTTPSGFMRGSYTMRWVETGEVFQVEIPAFSLDSPHGDQSVH